LSSKKLPPDKQSLKNTKNEFWNRVAIANGMNFDKNYKITKPKLKPMHEKN